MLRLPCAPPKERSGIGASTRGTGRPCPIAATVLPMQIAPRRSLGRACYPITSRLLGGRRFVDHRAILARQYVRGGAAT